MSFFTRQGYGRTLLVAVVMVWITAGAAVGQVDITEKFNDPIFRAYVYSRIGKTAPAPILDCDVSGITKVNVYNKGISDLSGIEYFTAMDSLFCDNNQLTTLDVSKNTALTVLVCGDNQLTTLDVSKNTALTWLGCGSNQLTTLDVSKNTALTMLQCYFNQLTTLDVSKNTALTRLECYSNQLTTLDVSKNIVLTVLACGDKLTTLDVSKNTALTELFCDSKQLTTLDVSKNTALTYLFCYSNQLTTLDVSKNTALTELFCHYNKLTTLDVSKNTALTRLSCDSNPLTTLDVSKNTALTHLSCSSNQLTTLDVSKNTALTYLSCSSNQLTPLDVSKNTALKELHCSSNKLTTLDVSKNTALTSLSCDSNKLTTLDVSKNTALTYLSCEYNPLTTLGVSKNIPKLYCGNQIRTGYIFGFWYIDAAYTDSWRGNISTNLTLYAKWIPIFTVTFNATGGTVIPDSGTTRADSTLASLPMPIRGDYAFTGWFTSETNGEKVTESKKYSANTTIYAQWTQSVYAVKLDPVGGTVTPDTVWVGVNGRVVSLPDPKKSNNAFVGWFTATTGGQRVTEGYTISNHITVYARWTPVYAVTFNAAGGTVTPETDTTSASGTLTSLPIPTKANYTFNDWFTSATGGEKVTTSKVYSANTTIYAQWKYNAVTEIAGVPNKIQVNEPFVLTGTVLPENAAKNTIVWSVENAGTTGAEIYNGVFFARSEGIVKLKATIADGKDVGVPYEQFFFINATISVASPNRVIPAANTNNAVTSIAPVKALTAQLTAGPNPASRSSGSVSFFRDGSRVSYATLSIYDASGNVVKKIRVIDNAVGSQSRRKVSTWNLRDDKGRLVSDGTYLVRGVVKAKDGKSEKVSLVVGVR